jgi:hypothetical protein
MLMSFFTSGIHLKLAIVVLTDTTQNARQVRDIFDNGEYRGIDQ